MIQIYKNVRVEGNDPEILPVYIDGIKQEEFCFIDSQLPIYSYKEFDKPAHDYSSVAQFIYEVENMAKN